MAHVLYILFFMKVRSRQITRKLNFFIIISAEGYAASLFAFLYLHIGSLKIRVAVYAVTIATMLVTAVHAFGKNRQQAAVIV